MALSQNTDISPSTSDIERLTPGENDRHTITDLLDVNGYPHDLGNDPGYDAVVGRCTRSQSESAFQQRRYTAREIRRIRERLLRTQKRPNPHDLRNFSRRQRLALFSLALVDFVSFCSMSVMAPFFPKEAANKGMTDTVSGFVFSFYALVMFLTSPLFGKLIPHVGARFLFMTGMFVAGFCNVLFGLLGYIDDNLIFTVYCLVVRGTEALGAAAYSTASYTFVADIFPDNMGSVMGILETFVGLGMSVGPALGGLLYSLGGFGLPFYVLGVLMMIIVPVNFFLLPRGDGVDMEGRSGSIIEMMRVPSVIVTSFVIVVASSTWGFLDPTLEPHLRQFQLSAEEVGLIFLLFSAVYAVSSPIWGWLADRLSSHWSMMAWGLIASTIGLLLLGPSPIIPFLKSSLWLNLVALSILGVAVALTLLPTFQGVLDNAIEGGCREDLGTYSLVAGIWSCMYSLGEVIGPTFGGVLVEHYGFPLCSTIMAAMTFLLAVVTIVYYSCKCRSSAAKQNADSQETDSLLSAAVGGHDGDKSGDIEEDMGEKEPLLGNGKSSAAVNSINGHCKYGSEIEAARSAPSLTVTAAVEGNVNV
ncbi:MFS-type transporter SLC18B1-like [Ischnura elegans]|uniref:MFS-type transporter SLC18B1-like n=1 Tax=Ischnura elegans TaxID=197161 RepID=UPI001ED8A23C|nr:MFS-type transporter SLC18B1-like [Ischnura elegans]